jgi:DNA polymerase III delta' subunit
MPPTFDDILDQRKPIDWLTRAYETDRLPHGLIFAGPVGVGKAMTARAMGALWLCEKPKATKPCGKCDSCRVFEAGNHPDFHVITKELIRYHDKTGKSKGITLSINVIRPELIDPAGRKAVMGRGKVFLIEQAELMQAEAQNAMLKTLEEPAGRTLIILLTDAPDALLPTIRSRSQLLRFAPLDVEVVKSELVKRGVDKPAAGAAAELSEGSIGLAIKWIDDGVVDAARDLFAQLDQLIAGRGAPTLQDWFKKSADAYAQKQLERDELASKDQATREGLSLYLRLMAQRLRRIMEGSTDPAVLERAASAIESIIRAETYLDANVNIPLVFQQLAMTLERIFAPASGAASMAASRR